MRSGTSATSCGTLSRRRLRFDLYFHFCHLPPIGSHRNSLPFPLKCYSPSSDHRVQFTHPQHHSKAIQHYPSPSSQSCNRCIWMNLVDEQQSTVAAPTSIGVPTWSHCSFVNCWILWSLTWFWRRCWIRCGLARVDLSHSLRIWQRSPFWFP